MLKKLRKKTKIKNKVKRKRTGKQPRDEKLCLTKGQLCNIVDAAEKKKGACPTAKIFIKELKAEMRKNKKKES